jgi:hypothetical protein
MQDESIGERGTILPILPHPHSLSHARSSLCSLYIVVERVAIASHNGDVFVASSTSSIIGRYVKWWLADISRGGRGKIRGSNENLQGTLLFFLKFLGTLDY